MSGWTLNMCPGSPLNDVSDRLTRNAEFLSDSSHRHSITCLFTNDRNIGLGKFGESVASALGNSLWLRLVKASTALGHLSHVLGSISPREMLRIAAGRVIALVKSPIFPFRRLPVPNSACNPIGSCHFSSEMKLPVAVGTERSFPWPAFILSFDFDLFPKPSNVMFVHSHPQIKRSPASLRLGG